MTALSESCSAALLEFFVPAALSDGLVAGRFESVVVLAELDDLPAVADFSPLDVLAADLSEVLAALEAVGDLSIVLDFEVVDLEVEDWEGLVVEDLALDDLLESALLADDLLLSDLVLLLVELLVESFDFSVVVDCPLTGGAVRVAASIATPATVVSRRSHAAKSVFICNSSHGWKATAPAKSAARHRFWRKHRIPCALAHLDPQRWFR